ncbi:MAG: hypothetical protein JO362_05170 [Streptomycetaceae bacterium]|nr:hypothetical protein [Streptomycetaceae bacterium]
MPALNVEFTEAELAELRLAAAAAGKSVKGYVHDLSVREQARRVFVEGAAAFIRQHAEEFDMAFPDQAPRRPANAA